MNLDCIYNYLEETTGFHKLYKINSGLSDLISNNNFSNEEKKILDIENAVWGIIHCTEKGKKEWMNKAFNIICSDLNYISARANNSKNNILKAIYSEILFYSEKTPYKKYINFAVEAYLEVLKDFHKELSINNEVIFDTIDVIERLLHLCMLSNSKFSRAIKTEIISILIDCSRMDSKYGKLIKNIIENMIEYKKMFKNNDFLGVDDIFWNFIKKLVYEKDYMYVIRIIDLGVKIDERIGKLSYPWIEEKCRCYEKVIKHQNEPMFARQLCIEAIENYKTIDTISKKISNIEKIYASIKDKIQIPSHDYTADATACVKYADDILMQKPMQILYHLANSKNILPPKSLLEAKKGFLTERFFPSTFLDNNSHPAKISNNEISNDRYLSNYRISFSLYEYTLQRIFAESIKANKLNLQIIVNYLINYSCFFDLQIKKTINKKYERYNWSSSILSIFKIYFEEMQNYFEDPQKRYPHLIEVTDSLVLKFEAFLRLYLESHKETSIATSPKEPSIVREKDINYLLYDDFIVKHFDFNDLIFFRYLFIAKEGINLRNDIAHSLFIPRQYTIEIFNLVFFAFLRLSKYDFPNTKRNKIKKHCK